MATKYNPTIVIDNLVLCLDAANPKSYPGSGITWTDMSGNENNGTLVNGVGYSSNDGGSLTFDGSNDYVQCPNDMFNPNSNFTISAWVNSDVFSSTNDYTIVSDYNNTGSFHLRYRNGTGVQMVDSYVVEIGTFSSSTLSASTWYNITVTRSSNTYTLYLNGSSTSTLTSSNTYDRGPQSIGVNYSAGVEAWDGKIATIIAYSRALTASEVLQNYNAHKGRYGL